MIRRILFMLFLLNAPLLAAQDDAEPPPLPQPEAAQPDQRQVPPRKGEPPEMPPPTVTIRREDGKTVEEYSINGNVYMVRVTPENAPPYVLVDIDGDGQLQRTDSEVGPHVVPPHWVLFEWD